MTDRYENIRRLLREYATAAASWGVDRCDMERLRLERECTPDTIRALLAERDALLTDKARMDWLEHATRSCTTYADGGRAFNFASLDLRHLRGPTLRAGIDAAIAAASEPKIA